jgi:hypothetical protein
VARWINLDINVLEIAKGFARKRQERYRALEKALAASRKIRWTKVAVRDR